jgi:hypothetical protein
MGQHPHRVPGPQVGQDRLGQPLGFVPLEADGNGRCHLTGRHNRARVGQLARSALEFNIDILPFVDGNGRAARLIFLFGCCSTRAALTSTHTLPYPSRGG